MNKIRFFNYYTDKLRWWCKKYDKMSAIHRSCKLQLFQTWIPELSQMTVRVINRSFHRWAPVLSSSKKKQKAKTSVLEPLDVRRKRRHAPAKSRISASITLEREALLVKTKKNRYSISNATWRPRRANLSDIKWWYKTKQFSFTGADLTLSADNNTL